MAGHGGGKKAIYAALVANAGIAVAKFVGYAVTGSGSMLAEGVHSVADTGNQALLLLGGRRALRAPTPSHPFGYGRERYFWSFIVSMLLFALGGLFAVYEAIEKFTHPHEIDSPSVAIVILAVAIGLEIFSFRTAIREANVLRGSSTWVDFVRRSKNPELPVVLLEDAGALIGLVFALAGVSLSTVTHDPVWDAIGTLSIGILLMVISVVLAVEMKSLLIGESASETDIAALTAAITSAPQVERLIHLRTQHLGPEDILVAAKIEMPETLTFDEAAAAIDVIEKGIRSAVPASRLVFIEPGVFQPADVDDDRTGPH